MWRCVAMWRCVVMWRFVAINHSCFYSQISKRSGQICNIEVKLQHGINVMRPVCGFNVKRASETSQFHSHHD